MIFKEISSSYDNLSLSTAISCPQGTPRGIIQFSHGMAEHKERYFNTMEYLSENGYVCVIHDHRGHGQSVKNQKDLGRFYTDDSSAIVTDLHAVSEMIRAQYPGLPLILFGHSMGTLVARSYLKRFDGEIAKLILTGPPTENKAVGIGIVLANLLAPFWKGPNSLLNGIAFAGYNKGNDLPFGWLSKNPENVQKYNEDPLCGFLFTTNGFQNLFKLQKAAYVSSDWNPQNKELPILLLAGEDDPVIQSKDAFEQTVSFLGKVGYAHVSGKLYPGWRHEILNEKEPDILYRDLLDFLSE